ncbi:hypothetical protein SAMN02745945_02076 [Peptoclostridium litorale DSM 5388]|uniref:Uncharacterized protein n=1 Tax=Peptoclostridium litorale DSM 5388 TaxID=1121324 RepID=A0A069REI8_PEPLI|nr:hypothetical protein [Peptoclostridium litorale]KDR95479.1 hypothetical protein CLIT_10c02060 [Peptoclostridium litorale DSM 5388]SIO17817.1 hypothetical protein SAMN02745945_02076 [Peptoclostridium litorale DSM 5388]
MPIDDYGIFVSDIDGFREDQDRFDIDILKKSVKIKGTIELQNMRDDEHADTREIRMLAIDRRYADRPQASFLATGYYSPEGLVKDSSQAEVMHPLEDGIEGVSIAARVDNAVKHGRDAKSVARTYLSGEEICRFGHCCQSRRVEVLRIQYNTKWVYYRDEFSERQWEWFE